MAGPDLGLVGLQPHTHLEPYGFEQGLIRPGYNPMSATFGRTVITRRAPVEGKRAMATAVR